MLLVARDVLDRIHRLAKREGRLPPLFEEREDQGRRAHLQPEREGREVGIAADDVEAAVPARVGMGLVARVQDRPAVERVDARLFGAEIGALGELEECPAGLGRLDAHLAGACVDLARHQEGDQPGLEPLERHLAREEIALVRPVAHAVEIGVVLVDPHRHAQALGMGARALQDDPLARALVRHQLPKRQTLRGGVFRMAVVIVKPGTIDQDAVAAQVPSGALRAGAVVARVLGIHGQLLHAVAPEVAARVLDAIVPAGHVREGARAHQGSGLVHLVRRALPLDQHPVLHFGADEAHSLLQCPISGLATRSSRRLRSRSGGRHRGRDRAGSAGCRRRFRGRGRGASASPPGHRFSGRFRSPDTPGK